MVSTRRSGSLSGSNSKRSSSSEDNKPASPKRQKVENGCGSEKSMPAAENSKELCTPPTVDPGEHGPGGGPIAGVDVGEGVSSLKEDAAPAAVAVNTPTAEGTSLVGDKPRSSFSSWSHYAAKQNPNFETTTPWCRLLSQFGQNSNVDIFSSNFTIGSSRGCNFPLKDHTISGTLCKIKHTQREGSAVAVLESTGGKGSVMVNGLAVKKSTNCVLNSGDEVVFGALGNHAYIFQQLMNEVSVKGLDVQSGVGKFLQLGKRTGDPSAVAGASILASLSSLRQDISRWKPPSQTSSKTHQGAELPSKSVVHDAMELEIDALEANSNPEVRNDKAVDSSTTNRNLHPGSNPDAVIEAGNVMEERNQWIGELQPASTSGMSLRCAAFKEDVHAGIVDGRDLEVSFDNFPYYLSENTKNVLIAASFIHLKYKDHSKYTSELNTVNPRILLSGPAGSEIYQEMLAKALANYYGAKLLIFDSHSFLGGLSSKEAELLKDGINAAKSCSCSKQSTVSTETTKNTDQVTGEEDTPSSSNATLFTPDSQPKMEMDSIPSSSGTAKNNFLKIACCWIP
uniref:FHA domain-containing protein n=1 Tax=Cucumis melo TaxID=3656 RepID=A0A9I9CEE4_CUCME